MIKNNIMGLLGYVILRILTFFCNFAIGFNSSKPKSEQDLINRMKFEETKMWIIFILGIILYCIFARFILQDQGSRLKNILSVSFIFVLGVIMCIGLALGYHDFEVMYYFYTSAFSPIFPTYSKEGGLLLQLPYTIFACILMGFSIRNTK